MITNIGPRVVSRSQEPLREPRPSLPFGALIALTPSRRPDPVPRTILCLNNFPALEDKS